MFYFTGLFVFFVKNYTYIYNKIHVVNNCCLILMVITLYRVIVVVLKYILN